MTEEEEEKLIKQVREVAVQTREIDKTLGLIWAALCMIAGFMVFTSGGMECNTKTADASEEQCAADRNRRAGQPEHAGSRTRYNNRECWCFDEKAGETTRLW